MRPPSSGLLPRRLLAERAILSERRAQPAARRALAPGAPASRARLTSWRAQPRPGTSPRVQPSRRVAPGSTLAAGAPRAPAAPTPPARAGPPAHWSSASYASPRQAVSLATPVIISVGVSAKTGFERAPAEQAP